jgi:hypothetical protein
MMTVRELVEQLQAREQDALLWVDEDGDLQFTGNNSYISMPTEEPIEEDLDDFEDLDDDDLDETPDPDVEE